MRIKITTARSGYLGGRRICLTDNQELDVPGDISEEDAKSLLDIGAAVKIQDAPPAQHKGVKIPDTPPENTEVVDWTEVHGIGEAIATELHALGLHNPEAVKAFVDENGTETLDNIRGMTPSRLHSLLEWGW